MSEDGVSLSRNGGPMSENGEPLSGNGDPKSEDRAQWVKMGAPSVKMERP